MKKSKLLVETMVTVLNELRLVAETFGELLSKIEGDITRQHAYVSLYHQNKNRRRYYQPTRLRKPIPPEQE